VRFPISHFPFAILFIVLATFNSAGYRYGASDQAFYAPAVLDRLRPDLYPRDSALIHSQAKLTLVDESISALAPLAGGSVQALFAALYVVSLTLLAFGASRIGGVMYRNRWTTWALLAVLTMRHGIARSGTNTLEGYFHPRQLAFGICVVAVALFLRSAPGTPARGGNPSHAKTLGGRSVAVIHGTRKGLWPAAALVLVAACVHPTTAMWFAVWLGTAAVIADRRLRVTAGVCFATATALVAWALIWGSLAGRLSRMDQEWIATLSSKEYLFPLEWPFAVWVIQLGYIPLILWIARRRRAAGLTTAREPAIVAGCLTLAGLFAASLPLNAARVQLAIQLQPARVFWMLDLLATIYVVWFAAEGSSAPQRRARVVALVAFALTTTRGAYVQFIAFPDRRPITLDLPHTDWGRVMAWARTSPIDSHWLADPLHAPIYGTSVRVAGERDVFVEEVKDEAIGMYDRAVAIRTRDRLAALGDFRRLTVDRLHELTAEYGLDFIVTEQPLQLPIAFSSGPVHVYRLR
jgi:hypothetical protein